MQIYVINAINDPTSNETTYCIGAFSSLENVASQLLTFAGNRAIEYTGNEYHDWGMRYWVKDTNNDVYFTIDIERIELDEQNIFI